MIAENPIQLWRSTEEIQFGQACAEAKGVVADARNASGNSHGGQAAAADEGPDVMFASLRSKTLHRNLRKSRGTEDGRMVQVRRRALAISGMRIGSRPELDMLAEEAQQIGSGIEP